MIYPGFIIIFNLSPDSGVEYNPSEFSKPIILVINIINRYVYFHFHAKRANQFFILCLLYLFGGRWVVKVYKDMDLI